MLLCIAREPGYRIRDIAATVGVTERRVHAIIADLVDAGYVTRHRLGKRSFYEIHPHIPLRHDQAQGVQIGELLAPLLHRRERH